MRLSFKDYSTFVDAEELDEDTVWDGIKRKLKLQPDEEREALQRMKDEKSKVKKAKEAPKVKTTAQAQRDKKIEDAMTAYAAQGDLKRTPGLAEAKDFTVIYKRRDGDKEFKWNTKGRDAAQVKRQFADNFAGGKIVMIKPAVIKPTMSTPAPEPVDDEDDDLATKPIKKTK